MRTNVQFPKYMKEYDRAGLLLTASCWSTAIAALAALVAFLASGSQWFVPVIVGYTIGALIGATGAVLWKLLPISRDMYDRHMEFYQGTSEREVRRHTRNYYRWALLANPIVVGPIYVAYKLMKFSTAWVWLSIIAFGAVGYGIGSYAWPEHAVLVSVFFATVGGSVAYNRRRVGIPDFAKRQQQGAAK